MTFYYYTVESFIFQEVFIQCNGKKTGSLRFYVRLTDAETACIIGKDFR